MITTRFCFDVVHEHISIGHLPCLFANALQAKKCSGRFYGIGDCANLQVERNPSMMVRMFRSFVPRPYERTGEAMPYREIDSSEAYVRLQNYEDNVFAAYATLLGSKLESFVHIMGQAPLISRIMRREFDDFPAVIDNSVILLAAVDYLFGLNVLIRSQRYSRASSFFVPCLEEDAMLHEAYLEKFGVTDLDRYYAPVMVDKFGRELIERESDQSLQICSLVWKDKICQLSFFAYIASLFAGRRIGLDELMTFHESFDIEELQSVESFVYKAEELLAVNEQIIAELDEKYGDMDPQADSWSANPEIDYRAFRITNDYFSPIQCR